MENHNQIAQQINELERFTRELLEGYLPKKAEALIVGIIENLEAHSDLLVRNDRRSLILLQRLQRAVGKLIVGAPNWLFSHGMLERSVRMSPDPTQLGEAIKISLFHMMLGRGAQAEERKLVALGLEAIRLGGMIASGVRIIENGYGLTKDQSVAFVPWRANAAERKMGLVATELLGGLLRNTLEYSYTVEPAALENNLREIVGGLMYFGGEAGCRSALEMLPLVVSHLGSDRDRYEQKGLVSVEDKVSEVIISAFEISSSTNALYTLREHSYPAFLGMFDDFSGQYKIIESIKNDLFDFDISVLPVESPEVKKTVIETVNSVFCSTSVVDHDRAARLLKMLKHFGLRGEELRLAATNSHVSNPLQWGLDLCLSASGVFDVSAVKPRDIVAQVVEFGANAPALYEEWGKEHTQSLEGMIEFFKDECSGVYRNALVVGKALKDQRIEPILSNPDAMNYISASTLYHYGADAGAAFGKERESFSVLEIAGVAGFIKRNLEKNDNIWSIGLESGLSEALQRCSDHPVTKASIGMLPPDSVKEFTKVFKDWFTHDFRQKIEWRDYRFKAERLENDLGM